MPDPDAPKRTPLTVGDIATAMAASGDQVQIRVTLWVVRTETDDGFSHIAHVVAPDGTPIGLLSDPDLADAAAELVTS